MVNRATKKSKRVAQHCANSACAILAHDFSDLTYSEHNPDLSKLATGHHCLDLRPGNDKEAIEASQNPEKPPTEATIYRLPTVSAAQALQNVKSSPTRCISTGLSNLDSVLQHQDRAVPENEGFHGGISRGKVTEVYGPPGVGKTALGMQIAASALNASEGVVWISDASHPLSGPRFSQILMSLREQLQSNGQSSPRQQIQTLPELLNNLMHFFTPSLSHLIALLCHPTIGFPPANTSLIIIESLSTLISTGFPRTAASTSTSKKSGARTLNPSARKGPIIQYVINALQKLAATRDIAIVVTNQCMTKMRSDSGAALVPSINSHAWEQGLGCRISLFRDWGWEEEDGTVVSDVRLVEVLKTDGIVVPGGRRKFLAFNIDETGLIPLVLPSPQSLPSLFSPNLPRNPPANTQTTPVLSQKRKISETDLEIPDSEGEDDEDYGWAEEDEEDVPPPPPQWQGSEDIMVRGPGDLDAEEEDAEQEIDEGEEGEKKKVVDEIGDSEDELAV
ncbi:hypothetical protein B7494_g1423 [Chlorociboria aeruginascens]|nr:hypothetical protein B7494_g1423 [Chlorociboria aeruginascens]